MDSAEKKVWSQSMYRIKKTRRALAAAAAAAAAADYVRKTVTNTIVAVKLGLRQS